MTEITDTDDSKVTSPKNDPIDKTENADPTLPIDAKEPTLPMERNEPVLPIDRNEFFEARLRREFVLMIPVSTRSTVARSLVLRATPCRVSRVRVTVES